MGDIVIMNYIGRINPIGLIIISFFLGCQTIVQEPGARPERRVVKHVASSDAEKMVRRVADAVIRDTTRILPFNWGQGVLMTGMMHAWELTGDERYRSYVKEWADHWIEQGIGPLLREQGYCGRWGPGFPVLLLYESTGDKRYLSLAGEIVQFMENSAERTREGGLSHFNGKPQLWVDTLDMACPVLAHYGRLTGELKYQREAARQLEIFARRLQNPLSGLFYHMYDEAAKTRTQQYWARGNGWVVLSAAEVLGASQPNTFTIQPTVLMLRRQLEGIVKYQDHSTGLWHTVLDAPETYLETSASAMFVYGLLKARGPGFYANAGAAIAAWQGLQKCVDDQDRVIGVSAGTGPTTRDVYAVIPQGTETWGTGAFLMAACAMAEMERHRIGIRMP